LTKKRKRLPGLALPSAGNDDAEDEEIEWLEWVLKKERTKAKGKTKAVDNDGMELADGLDGKYFDVSVEDRG